MPAMSPSHLLPYGWDTVVVDYRWYDAFAHDNNASNKAFAPLTMDATGRLLPAPNRFPSAADGHGFKALAEKIHAMGLKFGIHIMRGIPRNAVTANTADRRLGLHGGRRGEHAGHLSLVPGYVRRARQHSGRAGLLRLPVPPLRLLGRGHRQDGRHLFALPYRRDRSGAQRHRQVRARPSSTACRRARRRSRRASMSRRMRICGAGSGISGTTGTN